MSGLYMFYESSSALSVGEISHAPVPASLPRHRSLFSFFSLRGFLFRSCPHCLSEVRRAITCSITLPPRLVFFRFFHTFEVLRAFAVGRAIFLTFLRVSVSGLFGQPMTHCSTSLRLFRS